MFPLVGQSWYFSTYHRMFLRRNSFLLSPQTLSGLLKTSFYGFLTFSPNYCHKSEVTNVLKTLLQFHKPGVLGEIVSFLLLKSN